MFGSDDDFNDIDQSVSRRNFLTLAGAGVVALSDVILQGCTASSNQSVVNPGNESLENAPTEKTVTEEELLAHRINSIMREMNLEQKVAQLFVVRPESIADAVAATQAGESTREALNKWPVGGLIYFGTNLIEEEQARTMLTNTMQYGLDSNGIPPFLCVDEEGGTVSRIGGNAGFDVANVGNMADIGATNDLSAAKNTAVTIANYLKPLGFNLNFAPVCDIANNPASSTMVMRSFGNDPNVVARMASAQVEGFLETGMLCSSKHFPGIGSAVGDSHDTMIVSNSTIQEFREVELMPFRATIDTGVPVTMVGHLSVPAITGDYTPSSLSSVMVQQLLREELEYDGLVITDSLGMGAVSEYYTTDQSAVAALKAGCDMALLPESFESAYYGVLDVVEKGELSENRIDQSVSRILRTKLEFMDSLFV